MSYFINLSNEEKLVLADVAACEAEKLCGQKMTPEQYEAFVWEFVTKFQQPKFDNE